VEEEILNELLEYVDIEGTEIGEACKLLAQLIEYESYVSDEFYESLIKEVKEQLENFKKNSVIVEEERTYKDKFKYLEWK
jgi:hypothetical protein